MEIKEKSIKKQESYISRYYKIGIIFFIILIIEMLPLESKNNNLKTVYAETIQKSTEAKKNSITLGSYPQVKIVDESLIKELDNIEPDSKGNVIYEKQKYRKKNDIWYRYEPIEWRILEEKNSNIFVISEKILDICKIDESGVYWKDCSARKWLNNTFYQEAFSTKEKDYIKLSSLKNDSAQNNSRDYLFYPSVSELTNKNYGFTDNESRKASSTDYGSGSNDCYFTRDASWLILGKPMMYYGVYGFNGTIQQFAYLTNDWGARPCMRLKKSVLQYSGKTDENLIQNHEYNKWNR